MKSIKEYRFWFITGSQFLYGPETLAEVEKRYILSELQRLGGNKSNVAKSLGIGLKTLYRKLESYGEESSDGDD